MGSSLKVHSLNDTNGVDQGPSAQDHKLLGQLAKLWKSHAECDLGTRHQTGKLLNGRLDPPTKRFPQGRKVLKMVAEQLGIAESDLNRMRWFAHLFDDLAALRQAHPAIDSWTKFKAELPSLKPAKGGQAKKPAADPSRLALRGVAKSLANVTAKLSGLDTQPGDAERKTLVDALRELAEAVSRRLKISVVVVDE
jgi:hypothetical protein